MTFKTHNLMGVMLGVSLLFLPGCHYFKVGNVKSISPDYVAQKAAQRDYFIIHNSNSYFHLSNIVIREEQIEGVLEEIPATRLATIEMRKQNWGKTTFKYKRAGSVTRPTNEVHLYLKKRMDYELGNVSIPIDNIEKMEVYDEALGATVASYVLPTAATLAVVAGVIVVITCSCPYVYTYDVDGYQFQGGVFPGALRRILERTDFLVLKDFKPVDGAYQMMVRNEKMETEYINQINLDLVWHARDTDVIRDREGKLRSFSDPTPPVSMSGGTKAELETLRFPDQGAYSFDTRIAENGLSPIDLVFKRPKGKNEALLIVRAKNTQWFDHTLNEFVRLFGDTYPDFTQRQEKQDVEEHHSWTREQGVVLNIYIQKNNEWVYYDFLPVAGSAIMKEQAMKLRLPTQDEGKIQIRLESGFKFWEIDFVGLDFSDQTDLEVITLKPEMAIDSEGYDLSSKLADVDNEYLSGFNQGGQLEISFTVPQTTSREDFETTAILRATGYYINQTYFPGPANRSELRKFRRPGHFSEYSYNNYQLMRQALIAQNH